MSRAGDDAESPSLGAANRSSRLPLRQYAYAAIRAGILSERWRPGDPLSEQQLAEDLRISRTPVREALQALRREGFVEVFPSRGTFVAQLSVADLREAYELREALEAQAVRLAAARATAEDLSELNAVVALAWKQIEAAGNLGRTGDDLHRFTALIDELVRLGGDFHRMLARMGRNRRIEELLEQVQYSIIRARFMDYGSVDRWRDMWTQHQAIADAVARRDAGEAERLVHRHFHPGWERYR